MPAVVKIPTPLRGFSGGRAAVPLDGQTVSRLLDALLADSPGLRPHLLGEDGRLRNFVNVFVNGDDVRALEGLDTPVRDGDEVTIVPAIAGGTDLSNEEIARYSRHLIMPEVTIEGQRRLKEGSALLVGAGGLGSPAALYLAAAGVGRIGIVDFDVVDESNLQRQIVHDTSWVGKPKLESARSRLSALNPHIEIETYDAALTRDNALVIMQDYDVVVDGTDNFQTRYLTNDACFFLKKPNVYGSIFRFEGQASVFWPGKGPCYRCLYPEPPPPGLVPSCAEGGVLGILPGVIGGIQATEALKILMGIGEPLMGRLLLYDALTMSFKQLRLRRNPECPLCGESPTIHELQDYIAFCGVEDAEVLKGVEEITATELKQRLDAGDDIDMVDVREPHEWAICRIDGARSVPLTDLDERLHEFDSSRTYVMQCKVGVRSAMAIGQLRQAGFRRLLNLRGGLTAWAREVDPSMPTY
ncbi:MAG: molybdopterin-synthase adenylyltransferase MoeB [Acidobacteria bacterium]|jgi:adenylyltransferase/sulfurtransferase|nr:molybdopterin-synthase adenylyltransferase MoeB [Acidobacteriota bacterium]